MFQSESRHLHTIDTVFQQRLNTLQSHILRVCLELCINSTELLLFTAAALMNFQTCLASRVWHVLQVHESLFKSRTTKHLPYSMRKTVG